MLANFYIIENNAAVAYIGTTDLGFYNITRVWNDESDRGFASINYYFFYYLISQDQTCGDALSNSKLYFFNHFMFNEYNLEWIYRCYSTLMGTTLYGDPALSLYILFQIHLQNQVPRMDLVLVESTLYIHIQPPVLNLMVIKLDTYLSVETETQ